MNKRKLGQTDLRVSEVGLDTTKFAWSNDETNSLALLDAYFSCGGSFLQSVGFCADSSVGPGIESESENIVGHWHATRGINRDHLVLATRMHFSRPAHGGSSVFANLIRESCGRSLRQLRTKHLDLVICEWDEELLPIGDILEPMDALIRAGVVRHVVASRFPPWRVVDSLHLSRVRELARFEALQGEYSLLTRARFEAEVLSLCRAHHLGFVARSPLAGGFLARRAASIHEMSKRARPWPDDRVGTSDGDAILSTLAEIADKRLATPAQIALAWVLRNPQVTSALVSPASPREWRDLVRAPGIALSDEETGALANVTTVPDEQMELRHA